MQPTQPLNEIASDSGSTGAKDAEAPAASVRDTGVVVGRDAVDSTPIEKLINIPELCENVLDHLMMNELLLRTRVCRGLKANIEGSPRLQAKLFLASDLSIKKMAISATGSLLSGSKAEQRTTAVEVSDQTENGNGYEIALYTPHPWLREDRLPGNYRCMGLVRYAKYWTKASSDATSASLLFHNRTTIVPLPEISSLNKMFDLLLPVTAKLAC